MEPYNRLRAEMMAQLTGGREAPAGLIVAPCRVEGYHFYTNAGFLGGACAMPIDTDAWTVQPAEGFYNYRLAEEALRASVDELAAEAVSPAPEEQLPFCSRLEALLALREDERAWGPEGEALAWLLIRTLPPVSPEDAARLRAAFEDYFRQGAVDHRLIRALRLRMGQTWEKRREEK